MHKPSLAVALETTAWQFEHCSLACMLRPLATCGESWATRPDHRAVYSSEHPRQSSAFPPSDCVRLASGGFKFSPARFGAAAGLALPVSCCFRLALLSASFLLCSCRSSSGCLSNFRTCPPAEASAMIVLLWVETSAGCACWRQ